MHLSLFSLCAIDISYTGRSAYLKADKISGGVLRQRNIWNATRSIFYSNSSTGNWRVIIQMGLINRSPTANFWREGRGIQGETWRIKAQGKRLSLSQAAQPRFLPGDPKDHLEVEWGIQNSKQKLLLSQTLCRHAN